MSLFLAYGTRVFNWIEHRVEGTPFKRTVGSGLALFFLLLLLLTWINRRYQFEGRLEHLLPDNYLGAIGAIFTLLLLFEVLELILGLASDWWTALAKQIEILTLILLRDVFKTVAKFEGIINWDDLQGLIVDISASAVGALLIFVLLGVYYEGEHEADVTDNESDHAEYIAIRKVVCLVLLIVFAGTIVHYLRGWFTDSDQPDLFIVFYTFLIFFDVLLVLLALRYSFTYRFAFRNTSHAVATVLIRMALIAPPLFGAMIGVGTALYSVGITRAFDHYAPIMRQRRIEEEEIDEAVSEEIERETGVEIETSYDKTAV